MSTSILFSEIRFTNNTFYDTINSNIPETPIIIDKNRVGINTRVTDAAFIFTVNGNIKITSNIDVSHLTYSSSNLNRLLIDTSNAVQIIQRGNKDFIRAPYIESSITSTGSFGLGTHIPRESLFVHGNIITSNIILLGQQTLRYDNIYNPPVNVVFINNTSNIFDFAITGNVKITPEKTIVHQNGYKLSYSPSNRTDYNVYYTYDDNSNITNCKLETTLDLYYGGILDVTVTPEFADSDIRRNYPAIIFQEILTSEWSSNIDIYAYSNIGINIKDTKNHLDVNNTTYISHVTSPIITVRDFTDNIINVNYLTAMDKIITYNYLSNISNVAITEGNILLNGNKTDINDLINVDNQLNLSNLYINNNILFNNIHQLVIGSNFNLMSNITNSCIEDAVGVGTIISSNILTINGNINVNTILKNNNLYTINSQWNNTSNIYFNRGTVSIGTIQKERDITIYGNVLTSNLSINNNSNDGLTVIGSVNITNDVYSPSFVGMISYFAGSTPQVGWLVCNGQYLYSNEYIELYNSIGYTYGNSNNYFRLPDLRGEFIRGYHIDRTVGSFQSNAIQQHRHDFNATKINLNINDTTSNIIGGIVTITTSNIGNVNIALSTNETRPRNIALLPCIKYTDYNFI